jgi:hypothetical protein
VHDTPLVRRLERLGHLHGEGQRLPDRYRPAAEPILQRRALDQLEHQEPRALVLVEPIDRRDVGVIQRRQEPGFPGEPGQTVGVARDPPAGRRRES